MAKKTKKTTIIEASPLEGDSPLRDPSREFVVERAPPAARVEIPTVKVPVREAVEIETYSFPTKVRCPRCGALGAQRYCTRGRKQYRKCMAAVCRERFTVIGTKV